MLDLELQPVGLLTILGTPLFGGTLCTDFLDACQTGSCSGLAVMQGLSFMGCGELVGE